MSNWDYVREERPRVEAGDYRVAIVKAEETTSKAGNPMIVLTISPLGTEIKIKHYIVKNQYFNRNMTEVFDSFDITEGDFEFLGWRGAIGAARLKEDESGYLKVHFFIDKAKAESLPPYEGELPERNVVSDGFIPVQNDDGLPWEN